MGRLRIKILLDKGVWFSKYIIERNSHYSTNSTGWSLLNLDITESNYGMKVVYDEIDSALADMCFSNITITHSVY